MPVGNDIVEFAENYEDRFLVIGGDGEIIEREDKSERALKGIPEEIKNHPLDKDFANINLL